MQNNLAESWNKFWRNKDGRVVVWQTPNVFLIGWVVFTIVSLLVSTKTVADVFSWLGFISLLIWSLLEIVKGVDYFRRMLGFVVLALVILTIVHVF
jgi:hypothetical protein